MKNNITQNQSSLDSRNPAIPMRKRKNSHNKISLSSKDCENIARIVNYIWEDEERHYRECNCPRNHIFRTLIKLKRFA